MEYWLILVTIILSAFFSGMEIAFVSSNKLKIELDKTKGLLSGKILSSFVKKPSNFIATLLLGNNIALVIYGIFMSDLLEKLIIMMTPGFGFSEFGLLIIQTIIATFIILITAEFIPKALFRINPNKVLSFFAIPLNLIYWFFKAIIYLFISISELILKFMFRVKFTEQKYIFSTVDLDNYIKEFISTDDDEEEVKQELQLFQNAIDLKNVKLRECMIPRTEIQGLDENDSIKELKQKFIESGRSKIIIFEESVDNIIGYAHSYDMFKNPNGIKSIIKPVLIVPETMLANKLMKMLIQKKKSVAIVVDEFGLTSGMLTLEDVIEEIFGEIVDEHDVEKLVEEKLNDNEYILSGRLEIDQLNEKYKFNIPESEDYETLAGFIIHSYENIPELNEEIIIDDFTFIIMKASNTRIETVRMLLK